MKKRFLAIIMMLSTLFLVGCVNADVTIDLEKDGTGKAIVEVSGPNIVFDNISESLVQQIGKDYEKVEKIKKDNQTGYMFTTKQGPLDKVLRDIVNIESINPAAQVPSSSATTTSVVDNATTAAKDFASEFANKIYKRYVEVDEDASFLSTTYDIDVRLRDALYNNMTLEQKAFMKIAGNTSEIGIHIKSPIEAEESNATSVVEEDGKHVYNWDYNLSNIENISFKAKIPNIKNIAMVAGGAVLALIILIMIFRAGRKSKKA